jgi:hypothetical protein
MKRKIKQWWSIIPPISTKQTITSVPNSLNTKMTTIYDVGNSYPGLVQNTNVAGLNPYKSG